LTPFYLEQYKFSPELDRWTFDDFCHRNEWMYLLCDSMGVGRTGVFIALSIVLERMRFEGVVDMFQTVRLLRTQRPAMVQTEVWLDS